MATWTFELANQTKTMMIIVTLGREVNMHQTDGFLEIGHPAYNEVASQFDKNDVRSQMCQ